MGIKLIMKMTAKVWFEKKLKKEKLYLWKVEYGSISPAFDNQDYLKLRIDPNLLSLFQLNYRIWLSATLKNDGVLGMVRCSDVSSLKDRKQIWNIWLGRINQIREILLEEIRKKNKNIKSLPEGVL